MTTTHRARFQPGRILATPSALEALRDAATSPIDLLVRHLGGDWGDVNEEDKQANEQALKDGSRLLSAYRFGSGVRVWLITEADRSSSCILLPSEY